METPVVWGVIYLAAVLINRLRGSTGIYLKQRDQEQYTDVFRTWCPGYRLSSYKEELYCNWLLLFLVPRSWEASCDYTFSVSITRQTQSSGYRMGNWCYCWSRVKERTVLLGLRLVLKKTIKKALWSLAF